MNHVNVSYLYILLGMDECTKKVAERSKYWQAATAGLGGGLERQGKILKLMGANADPTAGPAPQQQAANAEISQVRSTYM